MSSRALSVGGNILLVFAVLEVGACGARSDLQEGEVTVETGGASTTGGRVSFWIASGGVRNTGGAAVAGWVGYGGSPITGGRSSTGGSVGFGGAIATGGRPLTGGTVSTGGSRLTGGATHTSGGASLGGVTAVGGSLAIGGTKASGGSRNSGGAPTSGGKSGVGGSSGDAGVGEWYVDAENGDDAGTGSYDSPFKTLHRASTAAGPGDTVNLFDGTWDSTVDSMLSSTASGACGEGSGIAFEQDVTIKAIHAGSARIVSAGYHGLCLSGGLLEGVRLSCANVGRPVLETSEGDLVIRSTTVGQCSTFGIDVAGTAHVLITAGTVTDYSEQPNISFAIAREASELTLIGGSLSFQDYGLKAQDKAALMVQSVQFTQAQNVSSTPVHSVALADGTPRLTMRDVSVDNTIFAVESYEALSNIDIDGLTIIHGTNGVNIQEATGTPPPVVKINRLVIADARSYGIDLTGSFDFSLTNSVVSNCQAPGIMISGSGTVAFDTVDITRSTSIGLILSDAGGSLSAKLRNVNVTENGSDGVILAGTAVGDVFDLGTLASPGNNVFRGNNNTVGDTSGNVLFQLPAGTIATAVGNTWDANQQGADAEGHYQIATPGVPLDVTSGAGPNYFVPAENKGVLRLAE